MRYVFASVLLSLSSAAAQERELVELSSRLADQIASTKRKIVAVTEFSGDNSPSAFSSLIVSSLNISLASTGKQFEVVTRNRLLEVVRELGKRNFNEFDLQSFVQAGKLVGADTIVSGEYIVLGNRIKIAGQLLDVASARIIGGHMVDIPRTTEIDALINRAMGGALPTGQSSPSPAVRPNRRSSELSIWPV